MLTTSVQLTDVELALLDGQCRPEIHEKVALAVARQQTAQRLVGVPGKYVDLVARVVGQLTPDLKSGASQAEVLVTVGRPPERVVVGDPPKC